MFIKAEALETHCFTINGRFIKVDVFDEGHRILILTDEKIIILRSDDEVIQENRQYY